MKFRYAGREFDLEGVHPDDYIPKFIATTRSFYEVELLEYFRFLDRRDTSRAPLHVDAGANIGNHSVYMGALLRGHTISFEPNARVLPVLRRNLERNVRAGFTVFDCALGASEGVGRVVPPGPEAANEGSARVEVGASAAGGDGIVIHTLDAMLATHLAGCEPGARVTLLKIDVEGMELDVLRGATALLREHRPHVFVEAATPSHLRALLEHLGPLGYAPVTRWGWRATPVVHFAHRPGAGLRLAARAYQAGIVPRYVAHALRRRLRERVAR